jgi:hypothetical protein
MEFTPASTVQPAATATSSVGTSTDILDANTLTNEEILREIKKEIDIDYEYEPLIESDPTPQTIPCVVQPSSIVQTPQIAAVKQNTVWHTVAKSTSKMPTSTTTTKNTVTHVIYPSELQQYQKQKSITQKTIQPQTQTVQIKTQIPVQIKPLTVEQQPTTQSTEESTFQQSLLKKTVVPLLRNNIRIRRISVSNPKVSNNKDTSLDSFKSENILYQGENLEKPWVCKACGRNYKWKNSLKCHLKNECGVPPRFICSRKCGYKTHIHSNLKRHLNSKFCKPNDMKSEEMSP